jgi:16S rRNA (guanine527-N7)-methyltransferase
VDKISKYTELLLKWNQIHNLIGKSTEEEIYSRHVKDSEQIERFLQNKDRVVVTDFGSGAGLPALINAINIPEATFNLFESTGKKATFLGNVKNDLDLKNVNIFNERIEEHPGIRSDYITARAFAELSKIFKFARNFIKADTVFVLHKGRSVEEEISNAQKKYSFEYELHKSEVGDGFILVAKKVKAK